jgi:NADPH2 dehydrogenase
VEVTRAVHDKGSFIFLQLWALCYTPSAEEPPKEDPSFPYVSGSILKNRKYTEPPRAIAVEDIQKFVKLYAAAAANAVHNAGFDGVEIHAANGYLLEQFLKKHTNERTDQYGGSTENRGRFPLEVVDAVVEAVGERKTAIRLSPWNTFNGSKIHYFFRHSVVADVNMQQIFPQKTQYRHTHTW